MSDEEIMDKLFNLLKKLPEDVRNDILKKLIESTPEESGDKNRKQEEKEQNEQGK